METYSINDAERLTGIKAHTLRIWEKRYKTLIPHRTPTHIRYYDDDQLRRLLNIATLQQLGHKISRIMNYTDEEVNQHILASLESHSPINPYIVFINTLVTSMMNFDESTFERVFSTIVIRYGVFDSMLNVIYPFLRLTGVLWSTANIVPSQEHFASNIVKRKLMAAIDGLVIPRVSKGRVVLFLPSDEWHEMGLLFADYILRREGYETIYLGQNVPIANLENTMARTGITHLLTFVLTAGNLGETLSRLSAFAMQNQGCKIMLSTNQAIDTGILPGNMTLLSDATRIFDHI